MKMWNILRADGSRWFGKGKMWVIIAGTVAAHYLMMGQDAVTIPVSCVLEMVYLYIDDPFFMVSLMLAVSLMGTSYCEEKEKNYFYFWIKRCSRRQYVCSKMFHAYGSTFVVLTTGVLLWICSMRLFMPWAHPQSDYFFTIAERGMGELLLEGKYFLYFFLHALGIGMLGGVISAATFFISLLLQDKMLVQVFPILLYYVNTSFLPNYSPVWYKCSVSNIFYFINHPNSCPWRSVVTGAGISVLLLFLFGVMADRILKRKGYD